MNSLAAKTADRSLKGRIAQKRDLLKRLTATADRHIGDRNEDAAELFEEMANDVQADILELQLEGRGR